ncbi:hypothetical protein ACHKAR_14930 [Marinoscillum luteum]|uniref:Sulfate ABC transporter permease n=2 Tax=Marinoscillum luteum TaxID=861051 RepID=A0ABW7NB37_9BACT
MNFHTKLAPMNGLNKYRQRFLDDWYNIDGKAFFFVLCLLYFSAFLIKRMFIIDSIAAFEILQDRGEMWIMDVFFGLQYLSVPIFIAWKFTLTSFLLWVGCFLFGYRVTYAQLWKMVMIMELVFIIPELLKVVWFTVFETDPTYHDFVAYYPLSLINFFNYESLDAMWLYPLKALNLFEILYWGMLVAGIYWLSNKKLKISIFITLSSYVLFFFLWLIYYVIVYK